MPDFVSVVSIEGVLGAPNETYAAMLPIKPGMALFRGVREVGRIVLSSTHSDRDQIQYWLKLNSITADDYEMLLSRRPQDTDLDDVDLRVDHISRVRAQRYALSLFVDSDPAVVAHAFGMGVVSILFAHPSYARPEHRPDVHTGPDWWAQIAQHAARQKELLADYRQVQHEQRSGRAS